MGINPSHINNADRSEIADSAIADLRRQIEILTAEQRNLQNERQRFQDFFDLAPDSYLVTNTDGVIQESNKVASAILNVAHDVLVGKKLVQFVAIEDRKLFVSQLLRVKAGDVNKLQDWEVMLHPYENVPLPVSVTLAIVRGYSNRPVGLRWMFRDISERKKADEMLRRSRQQLSDFVENAAIPLNWINPEGKIVWANQAEFDLLGYERGEYIGRIFTDFIAERSVGEEMFRRMRAEENLVNFEVQLRCRDGSLRDVLIDTNAHYEKGKLMHIRSFSRDITERKAAEEQIRLLNASLEKRVRERTHELERSNKLLVQENAQRKRAEDELLSASSELRRVTTSISDSIWSAEVAPKGKLAYRFFSPVVEKLTGHSSDFFLTSPDRWMKTIHTADRSKVERMYARLGRGESEREEEQYRITKADGTQRWVRDCVLANQLQHGKIRLDGVVSDVTDRHLAEERSIVEHSITGILCSVNDPDKALVQIIKLICEKLGWDRGELWMVEKGDTEHLVCALCWSIPGLSFPTLEAECKAGSYAKGFGLAGRVWATLAPVGIADVGRDGTFNQSRKVAQEGVRGAFGFPLRSGERLQGVLTFFSRTVQRTDSQFFKVLVNIGNQIGLFIERVAISRDYLRVKNLLQHILQAVPEPVFILSPGSGMVLDLNRAALESTGVKTIARGRPLADSLHPEDGGRLNRWLAKAPSSEPIALSLRFRGIATPHRFIGRIDGISKGLTVVSLVGVGPVVAFQAEGVRLLPASVKSGSRSKQTPSSSTELDKQSISLPSSFKADLERLFNRYRTRLTPNARLIVGSLSEGRTERHHVERILIELLEAAARYKFASVTVEVEQARSVTRIILNVGSTPDMSSSLASLKIPGLEAIVASAKSKLTRTGKKWVVEIPSRDIMDLAKK